MITQWSCSQDVDKNKKIAWTRKLCSYVNCLYVKTYLFVLYYVFAVHVTAQFSCSHATSWLLRQNVDKTLLNIWSTKFDGFGDARGRSIILFIYHCLLSSGKNLYVHAEKRSCRVHPEFFVFTDGQEISFGRR